MEQDFKTRMWIKKCQDKFGTDKTDYSLVEFKSSALKVKLICKKTNQIYEQRGDAHYKGQSCPCCKSNAKLTTEEVIRRIREKHGDSINTDRVNYINSTTKILLICNRNEQHPNWYARPDMVMFGGGQGCPLCAREKNANLCRLTTEEYIQKSKEKHDSRRKELGLLPYLYHKIEYIKTTEEVNHFCQELDENGEYHGDFWQLPLNHLKGKEGCKKCSLHGESKKELEVLSFINSLGLKIGENYIEKSRNILDSKKELDIYIHSKKVAIEFNGTYWHSAKFKDKNFHYQKSKECEEKDIRLIHIWEWMWNDERKQKILKNIILSACGLIEHKIYARKCKPEIIDLHTCSKETKQEIIDFFNNNNINGYRGAKYCCLLRYNEEIVHSFTFGYPFQGNNKYEYELIRGASLLGYSIIGGSSKLWSLFIKEINPESVVYYVDYNYFDGKSLKYLKPEFKYISHSLSFWNYNKQTGEVKNRQPMRNKELTNNLNIFKIYGAGTKTYVYNK